jgi:hypothetical protein
LRRLEVHLSVKELDKFSIGGLKTAAVPAFGETSEKTLVEGFAVWVGVDSLT